MTGAGTERWAPSVPAGLARSTAGKQRVLAARPAWKMCPAVAVMKHTPGGLPQCLPQPGGRVSRGGVRRAGGQGEAGSHPSACRAFSWAWELK